MTMDLSNEHRDHIVKSYNSEDPQKNLALFVLDQDSRFKYPVQKFGRNINPVMTPDLLKYFCLEQKEVWNRIDVKEKKAIVQIFSTHFGPNELEALKKNLGPDQHAKDYRTPIQIPSAIKCKGQIFLCKILDLSSGGCYVDWTGDLPKINDKIDISFKLDNIPFRLQAEIAWQNQEQRCGIGVRFIKPSTELNFQLQRWLYDDQPSRPIQKLVAI